MGPLRQTRLGWENEQLAHYLLSRFSFVAHPSTVGDDLGSDFFARSSTRLSPYRRS